MPAEMLDKNVETLKNMNPQTAKYAKWYVRVLDPKVIDYTFTARNEKVEAQKFSCVLVSNAPAQYMLGAVPFSFKTRTAAVEAFRKFTAESVGEPNADLRRQSQVGLHRRPVEVGGHALQPIHTDPSPAHQHASVDASR